MLRLKLDRRHENTQVMGVLRDKNLYFRAII